MLALREPPLSEDDARLGVFQMNGFILAHQQSARLLGDANARAAARASFKALLNGLAARAAA
jgi:hypothetical protein